MSTILQTKYYLSEDQLACLIGAGKDTKLTWYARNLTTGEFVNYGIICHIKRISGGSPFRAEFPDGTFEAGSEIKVAVGDWNVMDDNGRHCLQSAFFYIGDDGQAIPCKYGELPSQSGGVIPEMPQEYLDLIANTPATPVATPQAQTTLDSTPQSVPPITLEPVIDFVACVKSTGEIYSVSDCCSLYDPKNDEGEVNQTCANCKCSRKLYHEP